MGGGIFLLAFVFIALVLGAGIFCAIFFPIRASKKANRAKAAVMQPVQPSYVPVAQPQATTLAQPNSDSTPQA